MTSAHGNAPPARVAVIGLSAMGGSVARHLSALEVATTVYDLDPALGLGRRMGLDERRMVEVISASGGRSFMFGKHMPNVLEDDFTRASC